MSDNLEVAVKLRASVDQFTQAINQASGDFASALKNIELQASFDITSCSPRGGAGLQIGFSRVKSVRWTYLYYPGEKEIRLEFRNGTTSRILRSYHRVLDSPCTLKAELKSDGGIKLWANGELIESGNGIIGGAPVFYNSAIHTTDDAAT